MSTYFLYIVKHICVSGGQKAQDVGMVWKRCGVSPI